MNYIFLISFRNFLRQRRRNILLGIAIAIGVMILIMSNAFSRGISTTLLDRLIVYVAGHAKVSMIEKGKLMTPVARDRAWLLQKIHDNVPEISYTSEEISAFARAVGNGKGDYVAIVGVDRLDDGFKDYFRLLQGNYADFESSANVNGVLISEQKAKYLNLKVGDQMRVRFINVNGQNQTGTLSISAIVKSQNMYMDYAAFIKLDYLKKMMGYQPYETGAVMIILKKPKKAVEYADLLHKNLQPGNAYITGKIGTLSVALVPIDYNASANILAQYFKTNGSYALPEGKVAISSALAKKLHKRIGDKLAFSFQPKFQTKLTQSDLMVKEFYTPVTGSISENIIWINAESFFNIYNYSYPQNGQALSEYISAPTSNLIWSQTAKEWVLLPRTRNTTDFYKKWRDISQTKKAQPVLDVTTMYETASQIMQIESAFNIIMIVVGAIIFGIIMVGFLNSLRMTIQERTREIGTMRAIGMRKNIVRDVVLLEVLYLTLASWLLGVILSLIAMKGLSLIQFSIDNPMNMFMVDRRLYFEVTWVNILQNLLLPLVFAVGTAYFPARKASQLNPAQAFRHMT